MKLIMDLKKHIRSIKDYPKKGILFRDITTLIKNAEAFRYTNDKIVELAKDIEFDILNRFPNLIMSRSFSKAYGLAGFRVGFCNQS